MTLGRDPQTAPPGAYRRPQEIPASARTGPNVDNTFSWKDPLFKIPFLERVLLLEKSCGGLQLP